MRLEPDKDSWHVGRLQQLEFFALVIPDEAQRVLVSRNHFRLTRTTGKKPLILSKLSETQPLLLEGAAVGSDPVAIADKAEITFAPDGDPKKALLVLVVHITMTP